MIHFLHTFHPSPTFLSFGAITIGWYGVFMAVALLAGYFAMRKLTRQVAMKLDVLGLFLNTFVVGFVSARLYHVLNELPYYLDRPGEIIAVWHGGLAIHGGLIGGFGFLLWFARRHRTSVWELTDLFAPALALGQAIGRWGNYFNQELYGRPTNLPWGIPIDVENRLAGFASSLYFHPTFFYEFLWNLVIFSVLWLLWRDQKGTAIKHVPVGTITLAYIALYGIGRTLFELIRIDDTPIMFGIRLPIIVSIVSVVLAVAGFSYFRRHKKLPWG